ncbi:efflux RND transporter periplasmic adaptor subunit [Reinekea forsetii]|nr:efflux RND transporter periplasmic adaptor subunit [Reinekea forsetii]
MSKTRYTGPIIAITILVVLIIWMMTGSSNDSDVNPPKDNAQQSTDLTPKVQVINSQSQRVEQTLTINGVTQAKRWVTVSSETSGKVSQLLKTKGDRVKKGDIIAKIDMGDLNAKLIQANASVEKERLEYEGAQKLKKQGLQNGAQLAAALASYEQAKANLSSLNLQIAHKNIRAPFDGQLESLHVEIGAYLRQGEPVADIYDFSEMVFVGSVSEKDILSLALGQKGKVDLINGDIADAEVTYIGTTTNPSTRTFTVELKVLNVTRSVSGVTSKATIAIDQAQGHYISPALLFINESGDLGLKTVNDNNQVQFNKVDIIRSATDGVWVTGLPEQAAIIVVGQGFVNIDETVNPTIKPFVPSKAVGL